MNHKADTLLIYNDGEIKPVAQAGLETHDTLVKNIISPGNSSSHQSEKAPSFFPIITPNSLLSKQSRPTNGY